MTDSSFTTFSNVVRISTYVEGIAEAEFKESKLLQDAVVRNIEIIGEAAKNLSDDLRIGNSQIAWSDIMRMRNKIVHHYFRLDLDVVWKTVQVEIPFLEREVRKIFDRLSEE